MTHPITQGAWQISPLRRTSLNWPYDWIAEITSLDRATRHHQQVGRFIQAGARPFAEASANAFAAGMIPEMIQLLASVSAVLDMSDPDHPTFADSAADCLDALLQEGEAIRAVLARLGSRPAS